MSKVVLCLLLLTAPLTRALTSGSMRDDATAPRASFGASVRLISPSSNQAANFELKDQYDKSYAYRFPKDRVSVLAFGDRASSKQVEGWTLPLAERYQGRVDINGVAELPGVPSLSRGMVRRIIKSQVIYPVMLDWGGEVSKSYGYRGGRAAIFVINQQGHIVATRTGAASAADLKTLYEQIDRLVK